MDDDITDPLLTELNRLATNASTGASDGPSAADIARWQRLFGYTYGEARLLLLAHRADVASTRASDAHWSLVAPAWQAAGFDREAFEHAQRLGEVLAAQSASVPVKGALREEGGEQLADGGGQEGEGKGQKQKTMACVFRLGGVLRDVERVRAICGLREAPRTVTGWSEESGLVEFCVVDEEAKGRIEAWLAQARADPAMLVQGGGGCDGGGKEVAEEVVLERKEGGDVTLPQFRSK